VFFAGSGGGAGHASHATCDFRKLLGIESYCISDNVSELTARINDQSWEECYVEWLKASRFSSNDAVFVFSVGGGDAARKVSMQLVRVVDYANSIGASVVGVVGRDGGHLGENSTASVIIPTVNDATVTTQVEGFQAVIWHLIVGHPKVIESKPVWESITSK
jgi:D-sedoheptulose 7-phosphate isomerase